MEYQNENKFIKFFSGKRFYIMLAVCLIAVGVAGWSAFNSLNNAKIPENNDNQSYFDDVPSYNEPIDETPQEDTTTQNNVEDEPYSEPDEPTPTRPVADSFIMPIADGEIIKQHDAKALQYSKTYSDMRIHLGVDIKAAAGTEILACGDGVVTKIYEDALLGRTMEIDHGNGIVIKYCGLSDDSNIGVDYIVRSGQKLATLSGVPSECADDAHIHIEVTKNGKAINPTDILK